MPAVPTTTPAQRQARADAQRLCEALAQHRQQTQAAQHHRAGACTAGGWEVAHDQVDSDFDLDPSLIAELLRPGLGMPLIEPLYRGHVMRAAPPPRRAPPAGSGFADWLDEYLSPPTSTAAPGTAARFADEMPGVLSGPGNVLGNFSGALAGAWQGAGEAAGRKALAEGTRAILAGQIQKLALGPNLTLYNAAQPGQRPRVRLRARGLPVKHLQAMVPTPGGPVTQWRVNGAGTAGSVKVQGMTAQQMRNVSITAGHNRMPAALRWTQGWKGGGFLAFAPSALVDLSNAIGTDANGRTVFDGHKFLVDSAKSQSGNAAGFAVSVLTTGAAGFLGGAAAAASAPVIVIALTLGIVAQLAWVSSGRADDLGNVVRSALI